MSEVGTGASGELRFVRYPYGAARYAALDERRVRVEEDNEWGEFTRDGVWLAGPLRHCDPLFTRWVTSGRIMERVRERSRAKRQEMAS